MRWSFFGNLSKMDLSKIKIGCTISFCFKASKRPLLSSIRKSRLCQNSAVISSVLNSYFPAYSTRLFSVSQSLMLNSYLESNSARSKSQQTTAIFSAVGFKFKNSLQSKFRFL